MNQPWAHDSYNQYFTPVNLNIFFGIKALGETKVLHTTCLLEFNDFWFFVRYKGQNVVRGICSSMLRLCSSESQLSTMSIKHGPKKSTTR